MFLSLSVKFLTLFISRRDAKIHSVVIIYYHRVARDGGRERDNRASFSKRVGEQ